MKRNIKLFTTFLFFCVALSFGTSAESKGKMDYGTDHNYASTLSPFVIKRTPPPIVPVDVDKYAIPVRPEQLKPGENLNAWDITLKITSGAVTIPVDVVMVIDQSSSMRANGRIEAAIKAGKEFVRKMLPKGTATKGVRVALVSYDHEVHYRSNFTTDADFLCAEIDKLKPIWGTHTQAGLYMARKIMASSTATKKYIVLMSDGIATQQYRLVNPQKSDFVGKTGNPNDPTDVLIDLARVNPGPYVADDLNTTLKAPNPIHGSKVSAPNLPESKYNYSNYMTDYVTYDNASGIMVYEPRFPSPYYYYSAPNAAINEAMFAKAAGYEIFTIGFDLGTFALPIESLRHTATADYDENKHFIEATPQQLSAAFNNIAEIINKGVQRGAVVDLVAPGFFIKDIEDTGDVTDRVAVSQGTVKYNKDKRQLEWNTGAVLSSSEATLTYRVYTGEDDMDYENCVVNTVSQKGPDIGGFDTNNDARLRYTDSNGKPNQEKIFPRPTVKPGYGAIKRRYVLVDGNDNLIQNNGSTTTLLNQARQLKAEDYHLPTGGDHILPKWIKLDKLIDDPENQKFAIDPSTERIQVGDEYYQLVNRSISGTITKGTEIGIAWKRPIKTVYFAYVKVNNYWYGGTQNRENEWNVTSNWTDNRVPLPGKDVEFATAANNNGRPAVADLHLDNMSQNSTGGRVIGDLINASNKNLVITTGNQLIINGKVKDGNPTAGTIVVQSSKDAPTGTLKFTNPVDNANVEAVVEFYSKAYDCATCGMYRRSWQYFGIPVKEADFPVNDVAGDETINQWVEPFKGDKWQKAPYTPDTKFQKFRGYEITNSSTTQPTDVYKFNGQLYVGDANVDLLYTPGVNYAGANLVGNSYTAAIDIKKALDIPLGTDKTVYLFNTGTRDQWRKLDGSTVFGYQAGRYLAVPQNTAGSGNLPDRVPSMQTFMLLKQGAGASALKIKYDKLVKNTTVNDGNGSQIVLRSTGSVSAGTLPTLIIDVLGGGSADRLHIFANEGTTAGFDDGWDGRKMREAEIVQLYAIGSSTDERFAVSTLADWNNLAIGFDAPVDGKYVLEFALTSVPAGAQLVLHDQKTGKNILVENGASYTFQAKQGESSTRFLLSYSGSSLSIMDESSSITVTSPRSGRALIDNGSGHDCTVFISNLQGELMRQVEVKAQQTVGVDNLSSGMYIIRLENAYVNDVRRLTIKD